jgi:mannonate dehydratase
MPTPTASRSDDDELPMRVGSGQFMEPTEERLQFIRGLGVRDVVLNFYMLGLEYPQLEEDQTPPLSPENEWSLDELVELRERIEEFGLRLHAIENVPVSFYEDIMLGRDGREEQMEHMKTTVRNIGRAGIPYFGYHWHPGGVRRTSTKEIRGGAEAAVYEDDDLEEELRFEREYTEAELWENYEYFLEELVPVAEEAGVTLALHPSDPPMESLGGVPQLFRNFEAFERAMELVPSDNHTLDLCLGCWSEMGEDLERAIKHFGERGQIGYVHFRDVEGTVPNFHETFVDKGNYDSRDIVRWLDKAGFTGMIMPDHVPHMKGDTKWGHRGRAYTIGYLKGIVSSLADY